MAQAAAQHAARVDEADQRGVYAHGAAGAQSLQRPGDQKTGQRPCAGASERGQREQQKAGQIDALVSDDFAERAERDVQNARAQVDDIARRQAEIAEGAKRMAANGSAERAQQARQLTEKKDALEAKIGEYLEAGVRLVWMVYSSTERIHVFRPDRTARVFARDEAVDAGEVLPGFTFRFRDLTDLMSGAEPAPSA